MLVFNRNGKLNVNSWANQKPPPVASQSNQVKVESRVEAPQEQRSALNEIQKKSPKKYTNLSGEKLAAC